MRVADGFSHARSLGLMIALVLVQAVIALVGLAALLGDTGLSSVIVRALQSALPGPAGELLTGAVDQARSTGLNGRILPLVLGLFGALVTGTTAMGQLER